MLQVTTLTKGTLCRFLKDALFMRQLYDTKHITIELLVLKIQGKDGVLFLLFSLYFTSYFAQYLKISLADIRYLLL